MALEKKALLITPAYDAKDQPETLHLPGAAKDVVAMKKILLEKFAFKDSDIKVLQREQASKANIKEALDKLGDEVGNGSVVFLYYSGHGVHLPDSQDEGFLPTVTSWPLTNPLEEECFTGRDFLPFLDNLSKKNTKCFFIFDCCHSGQLYRVAEFKESGESGLRAKQFIASEANVNINTNTEKKCYTKADRGGWTPEEKDHFVYIAACNTAQVAIEDIGKGGRLTMAIENVLNSLQNPGGVSYEAFFRLLNKEFKHRGWDGYQSPQIEGTNLDTVLFGTTKVPQPGGILIKDVPNVDDVILDAGFLQNLSSGEYNVFDTCASEVSFMEGSKSKDWLGTIDVNEGLIEPVQAYGSIVERAENKEITYGCLAYIKEPGSIRNNVFINITGEDVDCQQVKELSEHLKATNMLNVSQEKPATDNPDLITITIEQFNKNRQKCWVARCRGDIIVPPMGLDQEEVMAGNVDRYLRFKIALEKAKKPLPKEVNLLDNVSLKIFKVEKVVPFTKYKREERIQEALKGKDIPLASDQRPTFKSHSIKEGSINRLIPQSGDAVVFQVSNNNTNPKDTVHICVLFYTFIGEIEVAYPMQKKGHTIELRGGDTAEGIIRLCIPKDSLRLMSEPDLSKEEPNFGIDTLVLYATSSPVDFKPLMQTPIKSDPALIGIPRGEDFHSDPISDLKMFLRVHKRCGAAEDVEDDIQLFIEHVELKVHK